MRINNNFSALTAFNSLTRVNTAIDKTIQSLSTGLRINSAADDAAGLAISENLRAQSAGMDRALRNAQDGISLIQTAEGALGETNSMLQRMRELAVQAANDTLTSQDRSYIQLEIEELKANIDRIAKTTQFNGRNILDGSVCGTVTSTDSNVKGYIRGAIESEGNYRIEVKANPGEAQVQKSNIMRIKHENVITNLQLNGADGFATLSIDGLPAGDYSISTSMGTGGPAYPVYDAKLDGEVTPNDSGADETMRLYFWNDSGVPQSEDISLDLGSDLDTKAKVAEAVVNAVNDKGTVTVNGQTVTLTATLNDDGESYTIRAKSREHITKLTSTVSVNTSTKTGTLQNNLDREVEWNGFKVKENGGSGGSLTVGYGNSTRNITVSANESQSLIAGKIQTALKEMGAANAFITTSYENSNIVYNVWAAQSGTSNVSISGTGGSGFAIPATNTGNTYKLSSSGIITSGNTGGADEKLTFTIRDNYYSHLASHTETVTVTIPDGTTKEDIPALIKSELESKNPLNWGGKTINFDFTDNGDGSFTIKSSSNNDVWGNMIYCSWSVTSTRNAKGETHADEDEDGTITRNISSADAKANLTGSYGINAEDAFTINLEGTNGKAQNNASILFTVTGATYNETSNMGTVTLSAVSNVLGVDGTSKTLSEQKIVLSTNHKSINLGSLLGEDDDHFTLTLNDDFDISTFETGNKFVYNIFGVGDVGSISADTSIVLQGKQDSSWPYSWDEDNGGYVTHNNNQIQYNLNADAIAGKEVHFRNFYLNSENGKVYDADIAIGLTNDFKEAAKDFTSDATTAAAFTANYVGKIAEGDTKLRDLEKFWDSSGVFMLEQPQVITISQNDGKKTQITLNASDTLNDVRQKLNDAISDGLGQGIYVKGGNSNKIVTFVENPDDGDGLESVKGTFLIRSLVPGKAGELTFSSDNGKLVEALGLNTVIDAQESGYTVSVFNAHDNSVVARNVKTAGNVLQGVIDKNVDIEFEAMSGVYATWSDVAKNFVLTPEDDAYTATVHIVKNNITFQTGANEGQELTLDIGNMSASSLGISGVNVMTHTRAANAITTIDAALRQVSSQRSKLGTYQNGLEHTLENLITSNEGITAADSRIRDADMSKSMMDLVKFRIINQSSTAMLTQANQLSRSVMSLMQQ